MLTCQINKILPNRFTDALSVHARYQPRSHQQFRSKMYFLTADGQKQLWQSIVFRIRIPNLVIVRYDSIVFRVRIPNLVIVRHDSIVLRIRIPNLVVVGATNIRVVMHRGSLITNDPLIGGGIIGPAVSVQNVSLEVSLLVGDIGAVRAREGQLPRVNGEVFLDVILGVTTAENLPTNRTGGFVACGAIRIVTIDPFHLKNTQACVSHCLHCLLG